MIRGTTLALAACSQPSNVREVDGTLTGDALVFACASPERQTFSADLTVENAPPGDYFLFESATRPTSTAALGTFAPEACASTQSCVVAGLGEYRGRSTLSAAGRLSVRTSSAGDYATATFFVFVRRAPGNPAPSDLRVKAKIFIAAADGGCGNPDPPDVQLSPL